MPQGTGKANHLFAYTPPTKDTAYGPDTNSMDYPSSSTGKSEARINSAFKSLGEKSDDTLGEIRGREAMYDITNTGRGEAIRGAKEALWPTPGKGSTEDPIEGRGG